MAVEVAPHLSRAASSPHDDTESIEFTDTAYTTAQPEESPVEPDPFSQPAPRLSPHDDVDFLLHPVELAKGKRAAENYLSTFSSEDGRKVAEEALETLATVISGGKCGSLAFPWQQIQPYHGAAALTILKEKGAPARVEALRCRADTTRGYRVVPDAYPPRQGQPIRSVLTKVIEECGELGFVGSVEQPEAKSTPKSSMKKSTARKKTTAPRGRLLGDGELRALVAASAAGGDAAGSRDSVFFSLIYRGLKIAEITALTLDSVKFSNKTGICSIVAGSGSSRGRKVELTNDELIALEDWLDLRGDGKGPLLCTTGRGDKVEGKRLTTAVLKEICETRAKQAQVPEFVPNDLSRSADALTTHRKSARRKAARQAVEDLSVAEKALYLAPAELDAEGLTEMIRFPFWGLDA